MPRKEVSSRLVTVAPWNIAGHTLGSSRIQSPDASIRSQSSLTLPAGAGGHRPDAALDYWDGEP